MSLLVVGLSHRSAPVDVLERVAVSCADAGKVLHQLLERKRVAEALLLSTCNRVEVYAAAGVEHLFSVAAALTGPDRAGLAGRRVLVLGPQAAAAITAPVRSASRVDPSGPDGQTG